MSKSPPRKARRKKQVATEKALKKAVKGLKFDQSTKVPEQPVVPVSVCMIVKNCQDSLKKTLTSLAQNFIRGCDELLIVDTGSTDRTIDVARGFGATIIERPDLAKDMGALVKQWLPQYSDKFETEAQFKGGCVLDFSEARQISTDAAKNDVIFWIDADDELVEARPGELRAVIDQAMGRCDSIFLDYDYAFDKKDGNVTTVLKRERVVDRRKYYWKGKCHETLIPKPDAEIRGAGYFHDLPSRIVHSGCRGDHQLSDIRNYCIIRTEIENDLAVGREPDTRSIFYMGNACRGLRIDAEALQMYKKTFELSGSQDDRFSSLYYSAVIYLQPGIRRPIDALDYAFRCLRIKSNDPRGYYLLSRCYQLMKQPEVAMQWFQFGRSLPMPENIVHSFDPEHVHSLPLYVAIEAAMDLKDMGAVIQYTQELEKARPGHPDMVELKDHVERWCNEQKLIESIRVMTLAHDASSLDATNAAARKVIADLPRVPRDLEQRGLGKLEGPDPRYEVSYTDELGEKVYGRKHGGDVTILCPGTTEEWGPRSDGIGGSERMVIEMAGRLQSRGLQVSVYCSCPFEDRGVDETTGVLWKHFSEFDAKKPRTTVIYWRTCALLETPIPAVRRIVWCHDVQVPADWTPERCALVDEVWVLSEYHKTTLGPALKRLEGKVWVTRNGIDSRLYAPVEGEVRKPNRVVFCSSPDRGVVTAIDAFQKACDRDDDAELHICYGFTKAFINRAANAGYAHIPDLKRDGNYYEYMQHVYRRMDEDPRIIYHGRLRWKQLAQLMRTSGVWLYPTRFPEISCMSAMEAQAAGCNVVCTDYAALRETVDWKSPRTYKCTPENAAGPLSRAIKDGFRADGGAERERFSFDSLAEEWAERLKAVKLLAEPRRGEAATPAACSA